jgi:hypothetical protein
MLYLKLTFYVWVMKTVTRVTRVRKTADETTIAIVFHSLPCEENE